MLLEAPSYEKVETWPQLNQALKEIHTYLDKLEEKKEKLRLAVDTETYICKEARDLYDQEYSIKKQKPKAKKEGLEPELLTAIKYPMPNPYLNKWGFIDCRVRLIQIGLDPEFVNLQYIIDVDKIYLSEEQRPSHIFYHYEILGSYLEALFNRVTVIGQAIKYEYKLFWKLFKFKLKSMRCTMLGSQRLWQGDKIKHKLSKLYKLYIKDEEKFKALTVSKDRPQGFTFQEYEDFKEEEQLSPWWEPELTDNQYLYSAHDVYLIWPTFKQLIVEMLAWAKLNDTGEPGTGFMEIYLMECDLIPAIAKSEVIGVKIDRGYYEKEVFPYVNGKMETAQAAVDAISHRVKTVEKVRKKKRVLNPEAKKKDKIIEHYEETEVIVTEEPHKLSYHKDIRELTGLSEAECPTTGSDDLIFHIHKAPIIEHICNFKRGEKLLGFFNGPKGYFANCDSEDIIHGSIHQIGMDDKTVDTARMSMSNPNLTNVPAQGKIFKERKVKDVVRRAFIPRGPGYKFGVLDFGQIELRLAAVISGDTFLTTCFLNNVDMHAETGRLVFNLDFLPVKGHPEEHWRDKGKTMRFARTYLMGIDKFMKDVYIDTDGQMDYLLRGEEGKAEFLQLIDRLDSTTPELTEYRKEVEVRCRELVTQYKSLYPFRTGVPFYVSKSLRGGTRRMALTPEQRIDCKSNPDEYHISHRVLYEKTGKVSTWANKVNEILREASRQAFNNEIQSTAADVFKEAIVEIDKEFAKLAEDGIIDEYTEGMILYIHDEVVIQGKEENIEMLVAVAKKVMLRVEAQYLGIIPANVSSSIGDNWNAK